jgi:Uma2 family endonuclease
MVLETQLGYLTIEQFKAWVEQPEFADRSFELIDGEIVEKMPGTTLNSGIAVNMVFNTRLHCRDKALPCYISTGDGAYQVGKDVVAPDMAYKQTPMSDEYPDPVAPLWAVEVISPTDKAVDIRKKRLIYSDAGILLWEVYPQLQRVDVYAPGQAVSSFGINDVLDGGAVLPAFRLPVKDIFAN